MVRAKYLDGAPDCAVMRWGLTYIRLCDFNDSSREREMRR